MVNRIPVNHLGFAISDAFVEHLQEEPLIPTVIFGLAGGEFARPINRQAHRLHLLFHVGDVFIRPFGGRYIVVQCGIFSGHAKCIPTHGHEDVVAFHAQLAGHHVVDGVIAHMTHVQFTRWVRQHRTSVEFWLVVVFGDGVNIGGRPCRTNGGFEGARGVWDGLCGGVRGHGTELMVNLKKLETLL